MYPKNALAQKANGPGLPPYLTKKTFSRMRLSHTLFSNQKLKNFSNLEFFLLIGHKLEVNQKLLSQPYCQAKGNPLMQDTTPPSSTQWVHVGLS